MSVLSGSVWGPPPLPELLVAQLAEHGRDAADAAQCAADIFAKARTEASASLFVDLGAHKFLGGDIDGAIAAWRHALSSGEPQAAARALLNLGLLYEQLHLHDRAISVLASSSRYQVPPDSSQAQLALARCQHETADHEQAMETLARLAQSLMSEPDRTVELGQTLLALGDVASVSGRIDRAERAWRAASATPDPATRTAATDRVIRLLHDLGHDDEIAGLLDGASLAQTGDSSRMVLERAALLAEVGRLDQARELVASIAGDGLDPNDRFRLADTRLRLGLVNSAIDELEELLTVADPESRQRAAFNLAEIYRSHEMRKPAEAMYRRVIDGGGYWATRAERALDATVVVPIGGSDEPPTVQGRDDPTGASDVRADARVEIATTGAEPDRDVTRADDEAAAGVAEAVVESLSGAGEVSPLGVAEAVVESLSGAGEVAPLGVAEAVVESLSGAGEVAPLGVAEAVVESLSGADDEAAAGVAEAVVESLSGAGEVSPLGVAEAVVVDVLSGVGDDIEVAALPTAAYNGDPPLAEPTTEPVVVLLSSISADASTETAAAVDDHRAAGTAFADALGIPEEGVDAPTAGGRSASGARGVPAVADVAPVEEREATSPSNLDDDSNPYASLAPDPFEGDVAPSTRNPYAELAPVDGEPAGSTVSAAVEDWESLLDEWPDAPSEEPLSDTPPRSKTGIFSRYV